MDFLKFVKAVYHGKSYFPEIRHVFPQVNRFDMIKAISAIVKIQTGMIGRHCGDTGDKLLQYLSIVAFLRQGPSQRGVNSIEIGTLFGGSCLIKLFALRACNVEGRVICIDPMAGYYGSQLDPVSKLPVTSENVYLNLKLFGFSNKSVELRQLLSTDDLADEGFQDGSFATLLIDGDHSYEGVMHDWKRFSRFVCPGGYVLFDDYSDPAWPNLTKAIDAILIGLDKRWMKCGQVGTTYVIKRQDIDNHDLVRCGTV